MAAARSTAAARSRECRDRYSLRMAFHRLRRAHHDRERLGDQRAEPPYPPQRGQRDGQEHLQRDQVGRAGDLLQQRFRRRWAGRAGYHLRGGHQPDDLPAARQQVQRQRRVTAAGQEGIAQRRPAAEQGDRPARRLVAHQRRVTAHPVALPGAGRRVAHQHAAHDGVPGGLGGRQRAARVGGLPGRGAGHQRARVRRGAGRGWGRGERRQGGQAAAVRLHHQQVGVQPDQAW